MSSGLSTRLSLPPARESGPAMRRALRRLLDEAGVDLAVRETAVLLATELVSNAVEHGGGSSFLDAIVDADVVRLEVGDDSSAVPAARPVEPHELRERGRGLVLIAALSSRWGTVRHGPGKTVWCEIARS